MKSKRSAVKAQRSDPSVVKAWRCFIKLENIDIESTVDREIVNVNGCLYKRHDIMHHVFILQLFRANK